MTALSENGTVLKEEIREMTELNTDFSQYYVTAEAPSGTRSVKVCISTDNASDTFFIDDIQLEKSAYASDANYILNGITRFPQNSPYLLAININRKVKLYRL